MGWRLWGTSATAAVVLFGCLLSPTTGAAANRPQTCGPAKGKTVLLGRKVRIYTLPSPEYPNYEQEYGCLLGAERTWRLNEVPPGHKLFGHYGFPIVDLSVLAIHAPWVSYPEHLMALDTSILTVVAKNLRTGETSYCFVGGTQAPKPGPSVKGLALKANGHRAWIGRNPDGPSEVAECPSAQYELESVELASSERFDLHSLSVHGSTLTWKTLSGKSFFGTLL